MSETNAYDLSLIVLQHAMILETAKSNPKILKAVTALAQRLQSGLFCDNFSEDELKFLKKMWKKLYTEYKELLEPLKNDIKELFSPQETITTEPLADKIAETKHFSDSNAVAPIE